MKDLLFSYLTGIIPGWEIPRDIETLYLKQLSAEHRVEETDSRGHVKFKWHQRNKDNHLLDCELQIMTMALICGLVKAKG